MNKDQVQGTLKNIGGKVQQEIGELTGNKHQQAQGLKNQVAGKIQTSVGDTKEAISDIKKEVRKGIGK